MGRAKRTKPKRLGEKLKFIRETLGLSFEEMIRQLDYPQIPLHRANVYRYETGKLEPPLLILLRYARLVNISTDDLIDDEVELPFKKLPVPEPKL
ncbi:MAG TPA: helix-turn-helix transcriptional regulator [Pyrinomonadaceae bacterium]|jgi:transcriptional regulator with XRE-family HTH domain